MPPRPHLCVTQSRAALNTPRPRTASDPDDLHAFSAAQSPVQPANTAAGYRVRLLRSSGSGPPCFGDPLASSNRNCTSQSSQYRGRIAGVVRSAGRAFLSTDTDGRHRRQCLPCRLSNSCLTRPLRYLQNRGALHTDRSGLPALQTLPRRTCQARLYPHCLCPCVLIRPGQRLAARTRSKAPQLEVGLVEFPIAPRSHCLPCHRS